MGKAFFTADEVDLECNVIWLVTGGMFSLARLVWKPRYSTLRTRWCGCGLRMCAAGIRPQRFILPHREVTPDDGCVVVETCRGVQLAHAGTSLT